MRVCPKCGFHDLPIWRNSRFYFNVDQARLSDIEYWDKELAEKINNPTQYYEDGHFAYLLQVGSQVVLRKELEYLNKDIDGDSARAKKERWFFTAVERHRKRERHPNQTKLLDVRE